MSFYRENYTEQNKAEILNKLNKSAKINIYKLSFERRGACVPHSTQLHPTQLHPTQRHPTPPNSIPPHPTRNTMEEWSMTVCYK